jgi:hypothetical protein
MIVVGPGAILRDDYFIRSYGGSGRGVSPQRNNDTVSKEDEEKDWDWDTDETDTNSVLFTVILLNTSVSLSTLLSFPPTLTHLVLINLSTPVPIHRLPNVCPLVVFFDVSYNSWLGGLLNPQQPRDPTIKAIVDLGRVDWVRWNHLRVLGFRGNFVPEEFVKNVNKGRWEDVIVIL